MPSLSPHQRATKWFFTLVSAVIFFIGAGALFMMRDDPFNPGWVLFILFAIIGLWGVFSGAGWTASKFPETLPEGGDGVGWQPAMMDKEIRLMHLRQLPSYVLLFAGVLGLLFMQDNSKRLLPLQISVSCILLGLAIIGLLSYKHELFVTYSYYGTHRNVRRGQAAKNCGKLMVGLSVLGLLLVWAILPLFFIL